MAQTQAISADQLSAVLRRSPEFAEIFVRDVEVESSRDTILSRITRLRLDYATAPKHAPRTLILKAALPERRTHGLTGHREVAFYQQVAAVMTQRLVPRCFDAQWDPGTNDWHLLLEDLTDSHSVPTIWPLPPTLNQCERIVLARAQFHAAWWDDHRLGSSVGVKRDEVAVARLLQELAKYFTSVADALPRERRQLYERLFACGSGLLTRSYASRNLTIVHGDAHVWNCFMPRDGGDDVRLFDWDAWRIGVAATDLAYMMAVHWYPDRRRRMERHLLDHYHTALQAAGVRGYDREALADDYRWAVLWQITTPVFQAAFRIPAVIWCNNLERVLLAFEDLGCRDLLT